ncbi:unnamed protein product [Cercopithifilaria johnstoni]|uniref:Uncharacterized protein n=1 Tax=Cercopithifilaria johnstoni TaxID=2874296 RepID=A0A8J2Q267_9BILA|nr:unnamed protein product [Cercopithifilaria johnstoni]
MLQDQEKKRCVARSTGREVYVTKSSEETLCAKSVRATHHFQATHRHIHKTSSPHGPYAQSERTCDEQLTQLELQQWKVTLRTRLLMYFRRAVLAELGPI